MTGAVAELTELMYISLVLYSGCAMFDTISCFVQRVFISAYHCKTWSDSRTGYILNLALPTVHKFGKKRLRDFRIKTN